MATSRELLFGLLALQNGFVTADHLVTAFGLWVQDKSRSLSDILIAHKAISGAVRELLSALVQQHLLQHGGDPERSLAALTSLPPIKAELEKIADPELDTMLGTLCYQGEVAENSYATLERGNNTTSGRFTVLRPHAQGGLGKVSVALDHELNRQVALKEILPLRAGEADCQERFLQEAEITGQLEHPGIVPVYALGTYGDGRPFYKQRCPAKMQSLFETCWADSSMFARQYSMPIRDMSCIAISSPTISCWGLMVKP
jgi:eukaryotic-like serine/threonine-protein kinase